MSSCRRRANPGPTHGGNDGLLLKVGVLFAEKLANVSLGSFRRLAISSSGICPEIHHVDLSYFCQYDQGL